VEHELKCWPEYFEAVVTGKKPFELRKADRPYRVGDTLWLREFHPGNEGYEGMDVVQPEYTGRECRVEVTYILAHGSFLQRGIIAMGIVNLDAPVHP
jgi:hypothetical protein